MESVKIEARAFLIWRIARSVDWQCTMEEVARELGVDRFAVARVAKVKSWNNRFLGRRSEAFSEARRASAYRRHQRLGDVGDQSCVDCVDVMGAAW